MGGVEPDIIIQDEVMNEVEVEINEDIEMEELVYALEAAFPATHALNHDSPPRWIAFPQPILPTTPAITPLPIALPPAPAPAPSPQPPVLYDDEDTLTYYSDYSDSEYGNDEQDTGAPASVAVPQASGPVVVIAAAPSPPVSRLSPPVITPEVVQNAGASSTAGPQKLSDTSRQTARRHPGPTSTATQSTAYYLSIRDIPRIRSLPSHTATIAAIAAEVIQEEEDVFELPRSRTEEEDDEYLQIEYCTPRRSTHADQGSSSAPGGSKST